MKWLKNDRVIRANRRARSSEAWNANAMTPRKGAIWRTYRVVEGNVPAHSILLANEEEDRQERKGN